MAAIAVAHNTTPFVSVYPWSGSGFGTKFSNPATLPAGIGRGVAFTAAGDAIAVAHTTTPFVSAYPWSGSGFGTKFSNPATLPAGIGRGVAFTAAGNAIAVAHTTTPFVSAYPWSGSGFGTKFSNPATLPAGDGFCVAFTAAGNAIAVAHTTTPFVSAYPWSGSGFGTKFSNPATLPAGDSNGGVAFTAAGDAIAVAHNTTPFVSAYPWSGSGFGTKFSDPATLPASSGQGVAFTAAGDAIAVAHATTPFVSAYPWSGSGFGTKFSNPATLPAGTGFCVAFTAAGNAIAVAHTTTPFVSAYPWSGSGFGTKFSDPATLPAGSGFGVAFTAVTSFVANGLSISSALGSDAEQEAKTAAGVVASVALGSDAEQVSKQRTGFALTAVLGSDAEQEAKTAAGVVASVALGSDAEQVSKQRTGFALTAVLGSDAEQEAKTAAGVVASVALGSDAEQVSKQRTGFALTAVLGSDAEQEAKTAAGVAVSVALGDPIPGSPVHITGVAAGVQSAHISTRSDAVPAAHGSSIAVSVGYAKSSEQIGAHGVSLVASSGRVAIAEGAAPSGVVAHVALGNETPYAQTGAHGLEIVVNEGAPDVDIGIAVRAVSILAIVGHGEPLLAIAPCAYGYAAVITGKSRARRQNVYPYREHLLPKAETPFNKALAELSVRTEAIPAPFREVWDPWACPPDFLRLLAHAFSVDLWKDEWPETRKRSIIANAVRLAREKGTLAAIQDYLDYVDAKLIAVVVRPQGVFSGKAQTKEEREAWLETLPQVRVWKINERGFRGSKCFSGGTVAKCFFENSWLQPSTALSRLRRRARWVVDGVETETTVNDFGNFFRLLIKGLAGNRVFSDRIRPHQFFQPSEAAKRIITLAPSSIFPWRFAVTPGLEAVSAAPQEVRKRGTRDFGTFSDDTLRYRKFLRPSSAWSRVFSRYAIYDGRPLKRRSATQFMGTARFGFPAHTAHLTISTPGVRRKWAAGEGIDAPRSRFWLPHDDTRFRDVRSAVIAASRASDRIMIRHAEPYRVTAGQLFRAGIDKFVIGRPGQR